jgi:tetratricopeptide (TPR) repeat protein
LQPRASAAKRDLTGELERNKLKRLVLSRWQCRGLLIALVFAAYSNSFGLGAALDGRAILEQDSRIRAASAENLRLIVTKDYWWPRSTDQLYRPVTTISFLFNYAVLGNGSNPAGYHGTNFLLHALNVCLVFDLALLVFRASGPAFFAAALWAVHPVGVECVANIAGRADLLATATLLGALLLYAHTAERRSRRAWPLAGLLILSTAGVFSKENAAILAGLMFLWDFTLGRWNRSRLLFYEAVLVPLFLMGWARWEVFRQLPSPPVNVVDNPLLAAGFWGSRLTAIKVAVAELWLLACPLHLAADRSYHEIPISGAGDPMAWLAVALGAALLAVVILRYRKDPVLFWSTGFLIVAWFPTSNLGVTIGATMAERFLYLPSIGFAIGAATLAWRLKPQRAGIALLSAAIVLFAARTYARNLDWKDEFTLAAADVSTAPNSFRLHAVLGQQLYERDPQRNLDGAIGELETTWRILKDLPDAQNLETAPAALGMYYEVKGDREGGLATPQGRAWYEKSLAMLLTAKRLSLAFQSAFDERQLRHGKPLPPLIGFESLDLYLGEAYWKLNRHAEAIACFRQGRIYQPRDPGQYDMLAKAYASERQWNRAAVVLVEKLLAVGFDAASAASLKRVYSLAGANCSGVEAGINPSNPTCPQLRNDTCEALADLEQIFREGRQPAQAEVFRQWALQDYGCRGKPELR